VPETRIGPRDPFLIGLTPDKTPVAGGLNITTPEDLLRYALLYTPSWHVVAKEQVISDRQLKAIQTMGSPSAYHGSLEEEYGTKWFGETPERNTAQWDHAFADGAMFSTATWARAFTSIRPATFAQCTSVWLRTTKRSRASSTRRVACGLQPGCLLADDCGENYALSGLRFGP
jgi:hypothetical protein